MGATALEACRGSNCRHLRAGQRDRSLAAIRAGSPAATETNFLYCGPQHIRYTPLCRPFDVGSTPSEITAADIEMYDWNYQWRNFRNYYKVWDDSQYPTTVTNLITDTRRFLSMWAYDWSAGELTDKLIRIGISAPAGSGGVSAANFYQQLTQEPLLRSDIGAAAQLFAAFHEAIIQQSSGQRPYETAYDPYFGQVTQQGISVDKDLAFTNWLGIWPYDDYDPTQSAGFYGSFLVLGVGPSNEGASTAIPEQSWSAAGSMLGEKGPWDSYPAFFPAAVALYAHDTQTPTFTQDAFPQMREWIGGYTWTELEFALTYFRNVASQNPNGPGGCASAATCDYNLDDASGLGSRHEPLQSAHPRVRQPRRATLLLGLLQRP